MTGTLQPLDNKFAIVDRNGNPTDYFIRWAQQKQIDIGSSITLVDLATYLAAHPLIAGTGIQLTPDGNIADGVNIHADVQAILDEITATRGAVLYRGLLGWAALLPGTAGNFLQTAGAGADPLWAAAGGAGSYSFEGFGNLLSLAALTKLAGASANLTLSNGTKAHLYSWTASGANTVQMAYNAAPATPWDVYVRFIPLFSFGVNTQFGLALRNNTSGKILIFCFNNGTTFSVQEWTNPTTFSSTLFSVTTALFQAPFWFRINSDGTTLTFYRSTNGVDWVSIGTRTIATFMGGIDQVGLGGVPQVLGAAHVSDFGFTVPA